MEKQGSKRVTMLDVAESAGVSYQTVSRVINDHPNVAPETRKRVLAIIRQMNYRPNKAARSLAARQSRTLAVITYNMKFYGPAQMVVNIEQSAREAGYDLIFSNFDPTRDDDIHSVADQVLQWSVDGVLMIAQVASAQYDMLVEQLAGTPLIQIDNKPGAATPSVIVDQYAGSRMATEYLLTLGHERICEISGPLHSFASMSRHEGWAQTLEAVGILPGTSIEGDWTALSGYSAAQQLIEQQEFTAIVAGNDQMALGAIRALREHGLRVPTDVSVVGFDDVPEAAFFSPPLTTIRQDFSELGRKGLAYLVELIQMPTALQEQQVIQPQLIVRESTAPPTIATG